MKYLIFIFLTSFALAQTKNTVTNYALVDNSGKVIETMLSTPEVAAKYPDCVKQIYPTALFCVYAPNVSIGWYYDSTTQTFTAPVIQTTGNVSAFTLQDPTPVVTTTNNAAITTNNAAK